jgi:hypothetical protein
MKLPAGATGFDTPAIDEADVRAFTAACHHAARTTGGAVTLVIPAGQTPNFHTVEISHASQRVAVLRHAALPLATFTEPRAEADTTLRFIDHPDLAAAITDVSDLQILTAAQLNAPLSRADLDDLSPAECSQIAHWQPNSIGDLLFNFWD